MVGGGDSACEEAALLTRFASRVYLIHRRDTLRASKIMAERTLANEKIFPVWIPTIAAYKTDDKGELEAVMLKNLVTGEETELAVKCVFMAIGHTRTPLSWVIWWTGTSPATSSGNPAS